MAQEKAKELVESTVAAYPSGPERVIQEGIITILKVCMEPTNPLINLLSVPDAPDMEQYIFQTQYGIPQVSLRFAHKSNVVTFHDNSTGFSLRLDPAPPADKSTYVTTQLINPQGLLEEVIIPPNIQLLTEFSRIIQPILLAKRLAVNTDPKVKAQLEQITQSISVALSGKTPIRR